MAKRGADKYLTDQNWDHEDDADAEEGLGEIKQADDDVLKKRIIRKARRRVIPGQTPKSPAFAGFAGLKPATASMASGNAPLFKGFNLAGNTGISDSKPKPFSGFSLTAGSMTSTDLAKSTSVPNEPRKEEIPRLCKESSGAVKSSDDDDNLKEYNRHLSALNKSVSKWIQDHVEKNPLCDLSPIFRDYTKHLAQIEEKYGHSDQESSQTSFAVSDSQETVSPKSSQSSRTSTISDKSRFTLSGFGPKAEEKNEEPYSTTESLPSKAFSVFGSGGASPFKGFNVEGRPPPVIPGFSFNSSMVGSGPKAPEAESNSQGNSEEYVPPKPESSSHTEEDAIFTKRCKLYYKKENAFADRGVGQLYLKSLGDKTQLLIRADTAISQILLNILLQPSLPLMKQGKNNVMITCIPNPPINEKEKDKIVPMLIRVKTSDDADALLKILEEKKKESASKEDSDR